MRKKGAESLSLTTIIGAIIVVVVLVVIIAFFLGGTTKVTDSIKRVFFGTTAGYDYSLASETCKSRCALAQDLPPLARPRSAYCQTGMQVDYDPVDGEADYSIGDNDKKVLIKYYCPIEDRYAVFDNNDEQRLLGIDCDLGKHQDGSEIKCSEPGSLFTETESIAPSTTTSTTTPTPKP